MKDNDGLEDAAAFSKKAHQGYMAEQLFFEFTKSA